MRKVNTSDKLVKGGPGPYGGGPTHVDGRESARIICRYSSCNCSPTARGVPKKRNHLIVYQMGTKDDSVFLAILNGEYFILDNEDEAGELFDEIRGKSEEFRPTAAFPARGIMGRKDLE